MPQKITAAVTTSVDGPVTLETLWLDDPGPGEVLVEMRASGICHTDFLAPQIMPLPAVLGHEGAGRVIATGAGVISVSPGDTVVGSYGYCGACHRCLAHEMYHCGDFSKIQLGSRRSGSPSLHRENGTAVSGSFFEQSSFASHALMTERNVVRIPEGLPPELVAPLGCGVLTGFGAVSNVFRIGPGQSIAIFGAGGVGLSAIMAARLAGATRIIAVDVKPARLAQARTLGATHTVDGSDRPVEAIRDLAGGGVDFALETVGQTSTLNAAIASLRPGGHCGLVAVPHLGRAFEISNGRPLLSLDISGIIEGRADPHLLVPKLAALISAGHLPMQDYVTPFPFSRINEALAAARSGETAKAVLVMDEVAAPAS